MVRIINRVHSFLKPQMQQGYTFDADTQFEYSKRTFLTHHNQKSVWNMFVELMAWIFRVTVISV